MLAVKGEGIAAASAAATAVVDAATAMLKEELEEPTEQETRGQAWACECYPDFVNEVVTGELSIPVAPLPDPCCCYGLPEKYLKPGPHAFYLGMGYKAPDMKGPEYLRTPGYFTPDPRQDDYTVKLTGRGLLPPYQDDVMYLSSNVVNVYSITGSNGFQVEVTEYGARVMSIRAPDADGMVTDVLLGFDSPEEYWKNKALHWGGVSGRLGDRIRGPRPSLSIPGIGLVRFQSNDEDGHYMGGSKGMDRLIWTGRIEDKSVLFTLMNTADHENYPGHILVSVRYTVLPVNKLEIHMEALCTTPTPFALVQPLIFNLAGYNAGELALREHILTVNSDKYYAVNEEKGYKGERKHVVSTPYDLRIPRHLRKILKHAPNKSLDALMWMREFQSEEGKLKRQRHMAKLFHPTSRRVMEVWSDLPVLHVSTLLGLTRRPRPPPDPVLLNEARKIIEEIIAKLTPCEDYYPPKKYHFANDKDNDKDKKEEKKTEGEEGEKSTDELLKELTEMRPLPNPGDVETLPRMDKAESLKVATDIIEDILKNVKARPPVYLGYNSYRYFDECGIMMYPQKPPLLNNKSNLKELMLSPGQRYDHTITYIFGVCSPPPAHKRRRFARRRPFKRISDLMIDNCSAASSLDLEQDTFLKVHDVCSVTKRNSESSI